MLTKTAIVKARVSSENKKKAEKITRQLGLDLSSYIRLCLHQLIEDKSIPFKPHLHFSSVDNEDISLSAEQKQAILDYIDEE